MIIKSTRIKAGDQQKALDYIVRNSVNENIDIQIGNPELLANYCKTAQQSYPSKKYTLRHFIISPEKTIDTDIKHQIRNDLLKEFSVGDRPFVHATHRKMRKDGSIEEHEHIMIAELNTKGGVLTNRGELGKRHAISRRYEVMLNETIHNSRFNKTVIEHEKNPEIKAVLQQNLDTDYYRAKTPYTQGQFKRSERLGVNLQELHENLMLIDKDMDDGALLDTYKAFLNEYEIDIQQGNKAGYLVIMKNEEVLTSFERITGITDERMSSMREIFDNNPDATPPPNHGKTKREDIMEDDKEDYSLNLMHDFTQSSMQIKIDELHHFLAKSRVPKNMSENEKLDWINGRFDLAVTLGLIPTGYPQPNQVKEIIKERLNDESIKNEQAPGKRQQAETTGATAETEYRPGYQKGYRSYPEPISAGRVSSTGRKQDRSPDRADSVVNEKRRQDESDYRQAEQRDSRLERRNSAFEKFKQFAFTDIQSHVTLMLKNAHARFYSRYFSDKNWSEKATQMLEDSRRLIVDTMTTSPSIALNIPALRDKFETRQAVQVQLDPDLNPDDYRHLTGRLQEVIQRAKSIRASYGFDNSPEGTFRALQQEQMSGPGHRMTQQMRR
jgi:hypothetical protein